MLTILARQAASKALGLTCLCPLMLRIQTYASELGFYTVLGMRTQVPRHALCTDLSFQLDLDSSVIPAVDLYLETVLASSQ